MQTEIAPARYASKDNSRRRGKGPLGLSRKIASIIVVLSFFPYVAFPVTTSVGLQLATIVIALSVPLTVHNRHALRAVVAIYGWTLPTVISLAFGLWFNKLTASDIAIKAVLVLFLSVLSIYVGHLVFQSGMTIRALVNIVSTVTLIHGAAAAFQWYSFGQGRFPFLPLFAMNPSFASYNKIYSDYALYVQRVFGLFPEPSAMAAVLGPWIVLSIGYLRTTSEAHRETRHPSYGSLARTFAWISVAVGGILIALSRSGYVIPFIVLGTAAAILPISPHRSHQTTEKQRGTLKVLTLIGFLIVLTLPWLLNRSYNSQGSWAVRGRSMILAVQSLTTSPYSLVFGVGPGQSPNAIADLNSNKFGLMSAPSAIYSFLLRYISETGLVGVIALLIMGFYIWHRMGNSSAAGVGRVVLVAWVSSFGLATSYAELLPLWVLFGVMQYWDRFFPLEKPERSRETSGVRSLSPSIDQHHLGRGAA